MKPVPMKMFVIVLSDGHFLTQVRLTSNYLDYERTQDREQAGLPEKNAADLGNSRCE